MFHIICKTLLHRRNGCSFRAHDPSMAASFSLIRYLSSNAADNPHSFTVSYLINSCGLSPKFALIASKRVQLNNPENPDLILSFFQNLGFSKPQISEMIGKSPKFLSVNPQKFVFPKIDFLRSMVVSNAELVRIITVYPWILNASLENQLVPCFKFLTELFDSEYEAIELIKRNPRVLYIGLEASLIPAVNILRKNGVPAPNIQLLFDNNWQSIGNPIKFGQIVEEVKEMGLNPLNPQFVRAISVLASISKPTRDQKVEVYKRWGWSRKDITTAFKKFPKCMAYSKNNIMAKMDFYVNKLGLDSSVIVNCPILLGYSLKKRLIPRGAVLQLMSSKGLLKLDSGISHLFICSERRFLEKHVKCHEEAPHLIKLYYEKLNLSDTRKSGKDEE